MFYQFVSAKMQIKFDNYLFPLKLNIIFVHYLILTQHKITKMLKTLKAQQIITPGTHNTLAEGTVLIGEIKAEEDFRIDGVVEGIINCNGKIIIGVRGSVNGQVNCANAEILGKLQGTIKTTGALVLKSTAVCSGDAYIKTLEIEPGAIFNGTCTMIDDSSSNG